MSYIKQSVSSFTLKSSFCFKVICKPVEYNLIQYQGWVCTVLHVLCVEYCAHKTRNSAQKTKRGFLLHKTLWRHLEYELQSKNPILRRCFRLRFPWLRSETSPVNLSSGTSISITEMATEKLTLYDPIKDTLVEVNLSIEDATRAKKDVVFATALMNAALKEQESMKVTSDNPSPSPTVALEQQENSQVVSITEEESVSNLDPDDGGSLYRWTTPCVLLLLETYKAKEKKFIDGKQSQKKTWEEVSEILKRNGHNVTGSMCAAKLRSLKKTYKTVKDHNSKSGNDRRTWQFFEIMDDIFSKKAWCSPVALASSSGLSKKQDEEGSDSMGSHSGCTAEPSGSKLSARTLLNKRLKQKQEYEEAKAKRHKEKMSMDEKFLKVLKDLTNNSKQ